MISFDAFINAIHSAILSANDALMEKNLELLNQFFEETDTARDASSQDEDSDEATKLASHTPKSVVVHYPHQTSSGIEMIEVHVPLITLVPLSMSQIEKVKLRADFEIHINDDELQLGFPSRGSTQKKGLFTKKGRRGKRTTGSLEITIGPHPVADGLKIIVEGYERALRTQIPH